MPWLKRFISAGLISKRKETEIKTKPLNLSFLHLMQSFWHMFKCPMQLFSANVEPVSLCKERRQTSGSQPPFGVSQAAGWPYAYEGGGHPYLAWKIINLVFVPPSSYQTSRITSTALLLMQTAIKRSAKVFSMRHFTLGLQHLQFLILPAIHPWTLRLLLISLFTSM